MLCLALSAEKEHMHCGFVCTTLERGFRDVASMFHKVSPRCIMYAHVQENVQLCEAIVASVGYSERRKRITNDLTLLEHAVFYIEPDTHCADGGGGKGVRPVYLRCSRGSVSWRYPRGALRVVLSASESSGTRSFRGCVKASGPGRVYLEGKSSLRLIYAPGDGKHEALHRCFRSRGQLAALYVEADELAGGLQSKPKFRLHYDLELEPQQRHRLDEEEDEAECRPCSKEELAKAYCQSDLVARGTVSAVERRPELESAELLLRVTKTLRRVEENEENELDSVEPRLTREVRIRVPTVCDARHGHGEFVIMAKKRLGDLSLTCAPRLEEWAEAVREMESAPCVLRS